MTDTIVHIKQMWSNGGRGFLLAAIACMTALIALASTLLALAVVQLTEPPYAPLYGTAYTEPQHVENPVVAVGGILKVSDVEKCNSTGHPLSVIGESHYRLINSRTSFVLYLSVSGVRPPGCTIRDYDNPLPPGVTPGTWVLEGTDSVAKGDERQDAGWISDPFQVVEGEQ